MTDDLEAGTWRSAWPDALAFAGGLAAAWWGHWRAADLVWSLWLSSLVVGYAMILWSVLGPVAAFAGAMTQQRDVSLQALRETNPAKLAIVAGIGMLGVLGMLAFFTLHFVGFHYVHSQLLSMFFPVDGSSHPFAGGSRMAMYREVFLRYWMFLPPAFVAERGGFARRAPAPAGPPSVTARAIAERKRALLAGNGIMAPYRQVLRMHMLLFFFMLAHFARLDNFLVYAVVYAVYFVPGRLLRRDRGAPAATAALPT